EIALNCRHDGLGVTFHAPEFLFRLISYRARVTCADWVQKHQVSMLQQTVGVGFRLIRRPRALVVAWEKTFGAQAKIVGREGSPTRPTVPDECDGARIWRLSLQRIGNVENFSFGRPVRVAYQQFARCSCVIDNLPFNSDGVLPAYDTFCI